MVPRKSYQYNWSKKIRYIRKRWYKIDKRMHMGMQKSFANKCHFPHTAVLKEEKQKPINGLSLIELQKIMMPSR